MQNKSLQVPSYSHSIRLLAFLCVLFFIPQTRLISQAANASVEVASSPFPDAPVPQTNASQSTSTPDSPAPNSQSSTPPATAQPPQSGGSKSDTANQQIKEQESQRILGVVPNFNISYRSNAVSLTAQQKFSLAFHTVIDPVTVGTSFVVAGYREALDDDIGFRWGPEGYLRRTGASYLDTIDGTMIGNAILPAILHQDPRYFRLGHGSTMHRILYSAATTVICKHDNTGKWEPNYSNVAGNLAAGAISNLYYPSGTSGLGQTVTNGLVVTLEGTIGAEFDEFWPDISRKLFHKDPTHGLDAQQQTSPAARPAAQPQSPAPTSAAPH